MLGMMCAQDFGTVGLLVHSPSRSFLNRNDSTVRAGDTTP